jgi:hypothetical protein
MLSPTVYQVVQLSIKEFGSSLSIWGSSTRSLVFTEYEVQKLIESMLRQCAAVIATNGGWTKY